MTAPVVAKGMLALSLESFGHKTATNGGAGFQSMAADATLVTGQSPPYGTYALRLDFNKVNYINACIFAASQAGNESPSVGSAPIARYVHVIKHTTAHPSEKIWVIQYKTTPVPDGTGRYGFKLNTSGVLELWMAATGADGTMSLVATGTTVGTLNAWYFLEHIIYKDTPTTYRHIVRLWDSTGAAVATDIDINGMVGTHANVIDIFYGALTATGGTGGCEVYFGCPYGAFEDGAADALKPTVRRLFPNGDGTYNDWGGRPYGAAAVNIVSSTNASPISVNATAHGLITGDHTHIISHATNTYANGVWVVTRTDADNFTLGGSTGNGVGGASGTSRKCNPTYDQWDDLDEDNNGAVDAVPDGTSYTLPDTTTITSIFMDASEAAVKRHTSTMTDLTANDVPYFVVLQRWAASDSSKGTTPDVMLYNGTETVMTSQKPGTSSTLAYLSVPMTGNNIVMNVPGGTGWTLAQANAVEAGMKITGVSTNSPEKVSAMWADWAVNANEANWAPAIRVSIAVPRRPIHNLLVTR